MIRLKCLGGLALEVDGVRVDGAAAQRQRLAVLAFLAAAGGSATRDQVLAALWAEGDQAKARHALSNALYGLRNALPIDPIVANGEDLRLATDGFDSDIGAFQRAVAGHDPAQTVALYSGPFLEGIGSPHVGFERWAESVRDREAKAYLAALEVLGREASASGEVQSAVEHWRAYVDADPWSTAGAVAYMRALEAAGDGAAALRHAKVHAAVLSNELDAEPDALVRSLEAEIGTRIAEGVVEVPQIEAAPRTAPMDKAAAQPHTVAEPSTRRSPRRSMLLPVAGVAAGLALVLALGANARSSTDALPSGVAAFRSVAVLPLDNLSPDSDNAYFADAMTEVLTAELSRLDSLAVVSRTSASRYVDSELSMAEIADRLGVQALIEGSVFRSGDQVRVTVQLIDGATDTHVWAESYSASAADPISLQRRVAGEIARAVSLELSPRESARLATTLPAPSTAQDAFLRGLSKMRRFTRTSTQAAIGDFEAALEIAPDFSEAAGALAVSYWLLSQPLTGLAPTEGMPQARRWAERALELDASSADALSTLGWVSLFYERDVEAARRHFEQATVVRPEWGVGHNGLSFTHLVEGQFEEAIATGRLAAGGIPFDLSFRTALAEVYYYARRYDEAIRELDVIEAADPNFGRSYLVRRQVHEALGQWSLAIEAHNSYLRLTAADGEEAPPEVALSNPTRAEYWAVRINGLEGFGERVLPLPALLAAAHAQAGNRGMALDLLERANDERSGQLVFLNVDSVWDPIRNEPRFQALAAEAPRPTDQR